MPHRNVFSASRVGLMQTWPTCEGLCVAPKATPSEGTSATGLAPQLDPLRERSPLSLPVTCCSLSPFLRALLPCTSARRPLLWLHVVRHLSPSATKAVDVLDDLQEDEKVTLAAMFMRKVSKGTSGTWFCQPRFQPPLSAASTLPRQSPVLVALSAPLGCPLSARPFSPLLRVHVGTGHPLSSLSSWDA